MKVGSLVLCTNGEGWVDNNTYKSVIGPKLNEICTVSGFPKPGYIMLEEYDHLAPENDTNNWDIEQFKEIQPPMDIRIDKLIEATLGV